MSGMFAQSFWCQGKRRVPLLSCGVDAPLEVTAEVAALRPA